jgi:uncharacterized protein YecE (DUF72 family)
MALPKQRLGLQLGSKNLIAAPGARAAVQSWPMGKIYAGTSGWAYVSWKPLFYPAKLPAAKFLSYYSTRLNSVEVNYTFRSLPTEKLLGRWIDAASPDFKFAFKAHQGITHFRRLRDASGLALDFIASLEPMRKAEKLGPVLFQLPESLKADVKLLEDFLARLPSRFRAAFEFRDPSWFNDEVSNALRKANVALCEAESDDLETLHVSTADFSYLRLRKEKYSPKARKEAETRVAALARRGDVFVYFKHGETPEGAQHAEALLKNVGS